MTDIGPHLTFLIVALALGAFLWLVFRAIARVVRERHTRNRRFAKRMGWAYAAAEPSLQALFESPPFHTGSSRRATDSVRGSIRGRQFIGFGYHFETGSGEKDRHDIAVCAVYVPGRLPTVRISPESPSSQVAVALGGTDIEVESAEFNRRWRVWSRDARAAHALLTPTMIARLLNDDLAWSAVLFEPGYVVLCTDGALDLENSPFRLDTVCDIADLVPAFLAQDYR